MKVQEQLTTRHVDQPECHTVGAVRYCVLAQTPRRERVGAVEHPVNGEQR